MAVKAVTFCCFLIACPSFCLKKTTANHDQSVIGNAMTNAMTSAMTNLQTKKNAPCGALQVLRHVSGRLESA
jgi:hypothetical protein